MNWQMMLDRAHRIGWSPSEFWCATPYEFETATNAQVEMIRGPKPKPMSNTALAGFLRGLPGYRKVSHA